MDRNADFVTQIEQLKKVIKHHLIGKMVATTIMVSLTLTVLLFFVQTTLYVSPLLYLLYPLSVLAASVFAFLYHLSFRKPFEEELSRLDSYFNLKEQLRSAYEFHQSGRESLIGERLLRGAGVSLKSIHFPQFYPHNYALPFLVVLVCIASFFIVKQLPKEVFGPVVSAQTQDSQDSLKAITSKLESLSTAPFRKEREVQKQTQQNLEKRVQEMAKNVEDSDLAPQNAFKDLPLLQDEVNTAQMEITKNLLSQISPEIASQIPSLEEFLEAGVSTDAIEQIENELRQSFADELPSALRDDLASLKRNQELEELLEQLSQEQERANRENGRLEEGPYQNVPDGPMSDFDAPNFMLNDEFAGDEGDTDFWMERESQLFPGNEAGRGERQSPTWAKRRKSQISKIEGLSGEGEQYKVKVQTLTAIGQANVKEAVVVRSYEQDLEAVFQKEKIPLQERELIKTYFLAIDDRK